MVLQPSLVAQARERTPPPPIPPYRDRSEFAHDEDHAVYMKTRRKAQERLREFKRPPRARARASHSPQLVSAVEKLRLRERCILFHVNVETGRKQSPGVLEEIDSRRTIREKYEQEAQLLPKLNSAETMHAALIQQEEHAGVTLSQVRRAVTAANKRDDPDRLVSLGLHNEACMAGNVRLARRAISKGLSATRPAVYPETARKRDAERVARQHLPGRRAPRKVSRGWDHPDDRMELPADERPDSEEEREYARERTRERKQREREARISWQARRGR